MSANDEFKKNPVKTLNFYSRQFESGDFRRFDIAAVLLRESSKLVKDLLAQVQYYKDTEKE